MHQVRMGNPCKVVAVVNAEAAPVANLIMPANYAPSRKLAAYTVSSSVNSAVTMALPYTNVVW
jgi:hypothetical protein